MPRAASGKAARAAIFMMRCSISASPPDRSLRPQDDPRPYPLVLSGPWCWLTAGDVNGPPGRLLGYGGMVGGGRARIPDGLPVRSEAHTSALQSLMRQPSAAFFSNK